MIRPTTLHHDALCPVVSSFCYTQHTSSLLSIWSLLHSSKLWSVELTHPYFSSFCSYLISIHHSTPKCHLITLQPCSPRLPLLLHPTARPSPAASVKRLLTKLGATGLQTPQSKLTATCSTFGIRTGTYFKTRGITEG